jgi:hypothetical protein
MSLNWFVTGWRQDQICRILNMLNYKTNPTCEQYEQECNAYILFLAEIAQSVYRLATGWTTRGRGSSSPGRVKNFHFSMAPRPALGSTQPPIKWVPGALSRGLRGRGVKLTTHLQLVPRSRKYGSIHPLPYTSSWRNA